VILGRLMTEESTTPDRAELTRQLVGVWDGMVLRPEDRPFESIFRAGTDLVDPDGVYESSVLPDQAGETYRGVDAWTRAAETWLEPCEWMVVDLEQVLDAPEDRVVSLHRMKTVLWKSDSGGCSSTRERPGLPCAARATATSTRVVLSPNASPRNGVRTPNSEVVPRQPLGPQSSDRPLHGRPSRPLQSDGQLAARGHARIVDWGEPSRRPKPTVRAWCGFERGGACRLLPRGRGSQPASVSEASSGRSR
jgi:hypothetical protein